MSNLTLYTYFRSSAAYRVRIALSLKGIDYTAQSVHLLKHGGEHHHPGYRKRNPQELVPTLVDGDTVLTQSLAIIEYLDECQPQPSLLPTGHSERAYVRSLAQVIACDIHPLNNLRVLGYLRDQLDQNEETRLVWYRHWIQEGLCAFETLLEQHGGGKTLCFGDTPTLADICLIPQVYNARRYQCDLDTFPIILSVYAHCMNLEAFEKSAPDNQADATSL